MWDKMELVLRGTVVAWSSAGKPDGGEKVLPAHSGNEGEEKLERYPFRTSKLPPITSEGWIMRLLQGISGVRSVGLIPFTPSYKCQGSYVCDINTCIFSLGFM